MEASMRGGPGIKTTLRFSGEGEQGAKVTVLVAGLIAGLESVTTGGRAGRVIGNGIGGLHLAVVAGIASRIQRSHGGVRVGAARERGGDLVAAMMMVMVSGKVLAGKGTRIGAMR
jgi:hypothetical protein